MTFAEKRDRSTGILNNEPFGDGGNEAAVGWPVQRYRSGIRRRSGRRDMLDMHQGIAAEYRAGRVPDGKVRPARRLQIEFALSPSERHPSTGRLRIGM